MDTEIGPLQEDHCALTIGLADLVGGKWNIKVSSHLLESLDKWYLDLVVKHISVLID